MLTATDTIALGNKYFIAVRIDGRDDPTKLYAPETGLDDVEVYLSDSEGGDPISESLTVPAAESAVTAGTYFGPIDTSAPELIARVGSYVIPHARSPIGILEAGTPLLVVAAA